MMIFPEYLAPLTGVAIGTPGASPPRNRHIGECEPLRWTPDISCTQSEGVAPRPVGPYGCRCRLCGMQRTAPYGCGLSAYQLLLTRAPRCPPPLKPSKCWPPPACIQHLSLQIHVMGACRVSCDSARVTTLQLSFVTHCWNSVTSSAESHIDGLDRFGIEVVEIDG
jgi:hypothetical protein